MAAALTCSRSFTAAARCSPCQGAATSKHVRAVIAASSHLQRNSGQTEKSLTGAPYKRDALQRRSGIVRASIGGTGALTPELKGALDKFVTDNKVVLFMKGTKLFPQCGFSNTCVQILNLMSVPYETVNILEDEQLRQAMKEYSAWPTFPQLYIDGEFFGGCDITVESFQKGELKEILEKSLLS